MHEQKTDKNVSAHYYSCGVDDSFDSACKICYIEPMGGIHSIHGSVSGNRIWYIKEGGKGNSE